MWPFKKSTKTVSSEISTIIPFDCIFNTLMESLDTSTVNQWTFDCNQYTDYLSNKHTKLIIAIHKNRQKATISGVYSQILSDVQSYQLYNKSIEMMMAINKRHNERLQQKDVSTLKRLFPQCFK